MEKLELKHLSPYLAYKLPIKILNYQCDYVGVQFSHITGFYSIGEQLHVTYEGGSTGKDITIFKPILRSLSDLTRKINHNGKDMILAKALWSIDVQEEEAFDLYGTIPEYWTLCISQIQNDLYSCDFGDILRLAQYHFDVFGLINAGFAIDINTLSPATT